MATQRGYYREELERAIANLEMCLTHLDRVIKAYEKDHPDIAALVREVGNGAAALADLIQTIHDQI